MKITIVRQAIADATKRRTAHHAEHNGRTVAFRVTDNDRINLTYDDGVEHRALAPLVAEELAETYLGITPPTPPKRASIRLAPGWSVSLRRDEVVPLDPGAGCPAMLHGPFGKSSTFFCGYDTGEVWGPDGCTEIPPRVYRAMEKADAEVCTYLNDVTRWLSRQR